MESNDQPQRFPTPPSNPHSQKTTTTTTIQNNKKEK